MTNSAGCLYYFVYLLSVDKFITYSLLLASKINTYTQGNIRNERMNEINLLIHPLVKR